MDITVTYNDKIFTFNNGAEAYIFDIGTYHDIPENQLIAYVSLVYACYLKDSNDTPLGKFCDYVAMNWNSLKGLSRYDILYEFYSRY